MTTAGAPSHQCVFCGALERGDDPLLAWVGERAFVILNKFPYNNGHLMIVPKRHVARLAQLDPDELLEIMTLSQAAEQALGSVYGPHGFNLGMNLGRSAGAGIADHLHVHIVPRRKKDGLKGFFWPRIKPTEAELQATAEKIRTGMSA